MDEINELEEACQNLKETTKKQYRSCYNVLMYSGFFSRPITTTGEDMIIKILNLNNIAENPNTKQNLLNVCIVIKKHFGKPHDLLIDFRNKIKDEIQKHHEEQKKEINEMLPDYTKLYAWMETLYDTGDYLQFVINFLLLNYFVRNEDLDCFITYNKKEPDDEDKNYLIVKKTRIIWIRNKYKTASKYGKKKIVITNKKLINAIMQLNFEEGEPIIKTNGEHINPNSLGWYVQNNTYSRLGEGNYFKVSVKHYRYNPKKLQEMGELRGTDINTVLNRYFVEKT